MEQHDSLRGQVRAAAVEGQMRPSGAGLLLFSDPGSWCSGTREHLGHLPGVFVPRTEAPLGTSSGAWGSMGAPVGSRGLGPSEARCAPLVRSEEHTSELQALNTPHSMHQVHSRMPQVANQGHAKAGKLRLSAADWDGALKEAAIPDTELARKSVRRTIRKLKAEPEADGPPFLSGANEAPSKTFRNDTLFVSNGSHGHEL